MQTHFFKKLIIAVFCLTAFSTQSFAQQTVIEHDSDTGTEGPQLLLLEKGDGALGTSSSDDGWTRIWFQNNIDLTQRWAFLARPHTGAQDTDGILSQPIIMAHNGTQIFGFSADGTMRINKSYTLPSSAGSVGQVLGIVNSTPNNKEVGWMDAGTGSSDCLIDADLDTKIKLIEEDAGSDTIKFTVDNTEIAEMYVNRTSIFNKLDVYDNMTLNGNLIANGNLLNNGSVTATGSLNSNGNLNLTGQLNSIGGNIQIAGGDNLELLNGNVNVNGDVNANGAVSANGNMNANGNLNLTGQLNSVGGNIQIASGDNVEVTGGNVNVNGDVNANGDIQLSGQLSGNGVDVEISGGNNLQVMGGNLMVNGNGQFSGVVQASCGVLTCSDERYKQNIQRIDGALNKIMQVNGVYYDLRWKDFPEKNFTEEKQVGLIAQNLELQFPELVATDEDGYKSVAYDKLTPVLVEAMKEQQKMIELLIQQNQLLTSEVAAIKTALSELNESSGQTTVKR